MPNSTIPEDAGWLLDEYDGPKFWEHVSFRGGMPYLLDPISTLTADAGECWTWSGWTGGAGECIYGRFYLFGTATPAHHISFRDFGNKIPEGMILDHLCRNTLCVRPNHLEAVTQKVNMERGQRAQATECVHGHEYTEENTVIQYRRGNAVRYCRTCLRASKHATYLKSKHKSA